MTVETTARKQSFAGGQASLTYTFKVLPNNPDHVKVKAVLISTGAETDLTYTSEYTVSQNSDGVGGTVTVNPTFSTLYTYTVYRETENKQESDYDDYNQFPADTLEQDLDQRTMVDQEQSEDVDRALKVAISSSLTGLELPTAEADTVIGWDSAGTALENYTLASAGVLTLQGVCDVGSTYTNATTASGITITQSGVLGASQYGLYVTSAAAQVNAELVRLYQASGSSDKGVLFVRNEGTGSTLEVDNNGTSHGVYIHQDAVNAAGKYALYVKAPITVNQDTPIVRFEQTNTSAEGTVLDILQSSNATGRSVYISQNNASSTGTVVEISNDATGYALHINQNGLIANDKSALYVESVSTAQTGNSGVALARIKGNSGDTLPMLEVINEGTHDGLIITQTGILAANQYALYVGQDSVIPAAGTGVYIYSNALLTSGGTLATIRVNNASSTDNALFVDNNGTGADIAVKNDGNGPHLNFSGDPTVASPADGDLWWTGSALNFYDGSSTTDLLSGAANAGLAFVSNTALSNVTSSGNITIESGNYYKCIISMTNPTAAQSILFHFRFNGDAGANYYNFYRLHDDGGAGSSNYQASMVGIPFTEVGANFRTMGVTASNSYCNLEFNIDTRPVTSGASNKTAARIMGSGIFRGHDTAGVERVHDTRFASWWSNAGTASSISIIRTIGSGTLTGNILLYKYATS